MLLHVEGLRKGGRVKAGPDRYQLSLGTNNDKAELCISSGERFVVSNSTTGPSLIDNRREASCLL